MAKPEVVFAELSSSAFGRFAARSWVIIKSVK